MRRKDVNMLEGSIVKGLLRLSVPIMIMNVVQSLFNIIDMTTLKTFDTGGGIAIGAVGVCGSLITLITGLVIGVSSGANVVIARKIGLQDKAGIDKAIASSIAFAFLSGICLAIIGVCGAEVFLGWANCPKELLSQAALYFRLYFAGMPLLMTYNFCAAILRASGDSKRPMVFLIIGGLVKISLTYLLVSQFHMGVEGVATSTIVSWGLSAFLSLYTPVRNEGNVKICLNNIRFYQKEIRQILHIGVPAGLQSALYSIANVIITATVNSFGPEATTGISIANNYDGILYHICSATSFAVMPYVSQNVGAGNAKRAIQCIWKGILITMAFGMSLGTLSSVFCESLASIMASDPVVIGYAKQKMVLISCTYFICGIADILGAALRGMGKPVVATITTMLYMCVLRFVWVYFIFPLMPNLTFLYLVWPIGWTLSVITLTIVLIPTAKKLKQQTIASNA